MGGDSTKVDQFDRFLTEWSRRDFLRRTGGALAYSAFLAGGSEFLAACGTSSATPTSQTPVKGGRLVESGPRDLLTFNTVKPALISVEAIVQPMLFDGLLINTPAGELVPALAESMPKISADGLSYTFTLRKANWSDGQPITSADVVFTYKLMYDPAYKAVVSNNRGDLEQNVESVTAPDARTVVIKTKTVYAPLLPLHSRYGILPQHVLGQLSATAFNTEPFFDAPNVVSGAFKFVEWKKGDHVTLARNDAYHGGSAALDQYILRTIPQTTDVVNALKTGELDCARVFSPGVIDDLRAQPNLMVDTVGSPTMLRVIYQQNPAKKASQFFSDVNVRKALIYALDRAGMVNAAYFKIGAALQDQAWPQQSWAYNPKPSVKYTFDSKKAESMLDAAGWTKGAGGIRQKNGQKLSFEVMVPSTAPDYQSVAQIMQQNLLAIGVEATPRVVAYAAFNSTYYTTRDFDVMLYGGGALMDPDESYLWTSRNTAVGGQNAMGYKSVELDALLDEAASTTDRTRRKAAYYKAQDILLREVPAPVLFTLNYFWAYNTRVHNYGGPNSSIGFWAFNDPRFHMKDVWVGKS